MYITVKHVKNGINQDLKNCQAVIEAEDFDPIVKLKGHQGEFKAAVRNFFWLKMIRNQYLSKYITSQCSKLSPYFSPIHNG